MTTPGSAQDLYGVDRPVEVSTQVERIQEPTSPIVIHSSSSDIETVGEESSSGAAVTIDLTADSDREGEAVVNLTSSSALRKPRRKRKRNHPNSTRTSSQDDSEVIILSPPPCQPRPPVLPIPMTPPQLQRPPHQFTPPADSPSNTISCPICMDSTRQFMKLGRTLVTTKCGHLFCDVCIQQSIKLNHKCPTCSTKLTQRQYHRIYL